MGNPSSRKPRLPEVEVIQVEQKDIPIWKKWVGTLGGLVDALDQAAGDGAIYFARLTRKARL